MYLSQLILNPRSREARRDAADNYQLHSTLCRVFANTTANRERVLFRVEYNSEAGVTRVLVQSQSAPDFSKLPHGYCAEPPQTRGDYEEKLRALTLRQTLRFRLRANPTKRSKDSGQRVGLRQADEQHKWLSAKLNKAGAEVVECQFMPHEVMRARKHNEADGPAQIHLGVVFEGVLRVTDPAALRIAIEVGIGSAKGYGFGLLSLAPA